MDLSDMWGPCRMDASIWSIDYSRPQLTGNTLVENYRRRGFARWWVAYVSSHMSPRLPILSLIFSPSGIDISLLISWFTEILRCWDVWAKESACVVDGSFRMDHICLLWDWCHVFAQGLELHRLKVWWIWSWWGWWCHEDWDWRWHGRVLEICTYGSKFDWLCSIRYTW